MRHLARVRFVLVGVSLGVFGRYFETVERRQSHVVRGGSVTRAPVSARPRLHTHRAGDTGNTAGVVFS